MLLVTRSSARLFLDVKEAVQVTLSSSSLEGGEGALSETYSQYLFQFLSALLNL